MGKPSTSEARQFPPRLIGMVHLLPLPGTPGYRGSMEEVADRALADARALAEAGFDALLVENYGDAPFRKERVEPVVIAAMSAIAAALRREIPLPLGVQVLRNDARASLSIAAAAGCAFIRVNVHTGVMITDQGITEGRADETLRLRASLRCAAAVFVDVHVKHAVPPVPQTIADAARDAVERGLADAVIVTGARTGESAGMRDIADVRSAVNVPVIVGSGVEESNVSEYLLCAGAVIVGTSVKRDGVTANPVDPSRAQRLVSAAR